MKFLFMSLLVLFTMKASAQNLDFDQTVQYINEKMACCSVYKNTQIKVSKNGTIQYTYFDKYSAGFNLFDLVSTYRDFTNKNEYQNGIGLAKFSNGEYQINFMTNEMSGTFLNEFNSEAEARRVFKALIHLKSLCKKEKDPFD